MARRADHTSEELIELVVATARQIITTDGIDALSARRIATAIGYTVGTLYNHFANIGAIVAPVNAQTLADLIGALLAIPSEGDPRVRLHAYADTFLDYIQNNRNLWDAFVEARHTSKDRFPGWYTSEINLAEIFGHCFKHLNPDVAQRDTMQAARLYFGSIYSIGSLGNSSSFPLPLDQDLRSAIHAMTDIHMDSFQNFNSTPKTAATESQPTSWFSGLFRRKGAK